LGVIAGNVDQHVARSARYETVAVALDENDPIGSPAAREMVGWWRQSAQNDVTWRRSFQKQMVKLIASHGQVTVKSWISHA
jgi:hypothetical protein